MSINTVLNKIAKINNQTELASHEVELQLVDEIKTAVQKGEFALEDLSDSLASYTTIKKQFDEIFKKSNDGYDRVQKYIVEAQKWDQQSSPIFKKVVDASKELGLQKEQINGVAAFEKIMISIGKLRGEAQRILSQA